MAKKLWGGRFTAKMNPLFEKFSSSIETDWRLAECDLIGSYLHIYVLYGAKLISKAEFLALKKGIKSLLSDAQKGALRPDPACEDVHSCIQNMLEKKVGKAVEKLQTARSRNDQVAFDTRFYCLEESMGLHHAIFELNKSLKALAGRYASLIIPGYTHLQHAQPVYFKDYLGAYEAMFVEDAARLECFAGRLEITLGSGALAGTPIPALVYKTQIKKALKELGLVDPIYEVLPPKNSLVVVSDRDFVVELLSILAIFGMHVSRLCEDLILWSSKEFDFIELGDEFCTGSSLMPQKKNPDALELMRGASGILYGDLMSVLTTMKGLPLSYNRDMQWDKQPLFASLDIVRFETYILTQLVPAIKMKKLSIDRQLEDESLYATDLADYLVSKGETFRSAHESIGRLVRYSISYNKAIKDMSDAELKQFSRHFGKEEVLKRLDPKSSVYFKKSVVRK
ncbi:MAG TPA: argininosuccinate lyase [Candidatus Omnitrophica bacterium]|nr:argininosuccinate lyase [Candidatus Omnitrophota bacterium]